MSLLVGVSRASHIITRGLEVWQLVTRVCFHGFGGGALGSCIAVAVSSTYFVGRVHIHVGHD